MILEVCKAIKNDPYLYVFYANGEKELSICKTVKSYEGDNYVRLNRQRLVHKSLIAEIKNSKAILKDGRQHKVSRRRLKNLVETMQC